MDKILATGALSEISRGVWRSGSDPMAGSDDPLVVLVTFPSDEVAAEICRALVGERRAACAKPRSGDPELVFLGRCPQDDAEILALVEDDEGRALALEARIAELHPYDTPEVVALEPAHVEARYLAWLRGSVGPAARGRDVSGPADAVASERSGPRARRAGLLLGGALPRAPLLALGSIHSSAGSRPRRR